MNKAMVVDVAGSSLPTILKAKSERKRLVDVQYIAEYPVISH